MSSPWRTSTPSHADFGHSTICVQRKSAIVPPSSCRVTVASHTCVVRPRCTGLATHVSVPSRAVPRKLALELDRREIVGACRQVRDAAVAARGVGERDDGRRVQVAVRREQLGPDVELGDEQALLDRHHAKAEECRQPPRAALVQHLDGNSGTQRHVDRCPRQRRCPTQPGPTPARQAARPDRCRLPAPCRDGRRPCRRPAARRD